MRIRSRNGHRHFVYGGHKIREELLNWKKSGNNLLKAGKTPSAPPYFPELATLLLDEGVSEFNIITIPPPSFHDYAHAGGWYPAEVLAENLCRNIKMPLTLLWPDRYTEKTKKIMEGNIDKIYTIPEGVKNQFHPHLNARFVVLILYKYRLRFQLFRWKIWNLQLPFW